MKLEQTEEAVKAHVKKMMESPRPRRDKPVDLQPIDSEECGGRCEGCGMHVGLLLVRYYTKYCLNCWEDTRGTR